MRLAKWSLIAILVGSAAVAGAPEHGTDLPPALAGYRSWTKLTAEPKEIPYTRSMMCGPPSFFRTDKQYGPHEDRWVMVYANPAALAALKSKDVKRFPVGAMIAKEKLLQAEDDVPDGVAFMIKRGGEKFAGSGGWEFLYFPSTDSDALDQSCVNCHRGGAGKDYVFSTFAKPAE